MRQKPLKRKVLQVGWENSEINGAARKLVCAGLLLRENVTPNEQESTSCKRRRETSNPAPSTCSFEGLNCKENDLHIRPSSHVEEEYIDSMALDCHEALEVWAAYYGADLYATRMNTEQLSHLDDFPSDPIQYCLSTSYGNEASCRAP